MTIQMQDPASLNSQLMTMTTELRDTFQRIQNTSQWLSNFQIADIQTLYNVSAADAAVIQSTVGNLATLNRVYTGQAAQTAAFDFRTNSSAVWGGR